MEEDTYEETDDNSTFISDTPYITKKEVMTVNKTIQIPIIPGHRELALCVAYKD